MHTASVLVEREVTPERRAVRCLTDGELKAVAQMAKRAEKHYGCPQDIEWALDADLPDGENLLLLQSRPETVHSTKPCAPNGHAAGGISRRRSPQAFGASPHARPQHVRSNPHHSTSRLLTSTAVTAPTVEPVLKGHAMSLKSFPKPSELAVPPGAEGWEKLYPYYLVFQDKLKDAEDAKFWFCDSQHWPTVFKPFETIGGEFAVKCLGQYNARHLMIPNANGIEFRIHLGYLTCRPSRCRRTRSPPACPLFEQRVGHYFQNWDQLLKQWHIKVKGTIDEMETLLLPEAPGHGADGGHRLRQGQGRLRELLESYDRLSSWPTRTGSTTSSSSTSATSPTWTSSTSARQCSPTSRTSPSPPWCRAWTWSCSARTTNSRSWPRWPSSWVSRPSFANTDDVDATLAAIAAAPGGDRWIAQYEDAKDPWFNFTVGNGFYGHDKYWNEHQEIPLGYIADYIRRLDDGQEIMRPVEALIARTDRIIEEYRDLLEGENQATFDAKRGLAATAYPYVENHNFYIEHWTMGVFWRKIRELSRMLQAEGFWTEPDDLLYLSRNEVRDALFDLVIGWGVGAKPIGPTYWPEEIERRRGIVDALKTARPQPGAEHARRKSSPNRSPGCCGASPPSRSSSGSAPARHRGRRVCAAWRPRRASWRAWPA